jgi:hypothetical protein
MLMLSSLARARRRWLRKLYLLAACPMGCLAQPRRLTPQCRAGSIEAAAEIQVRTEVSGGTSRRVQACEVQACKRPFEQMRSTGAAITSWAPLYANSVVIGVGWVGFRSRSLGGGEGSAEQCSGLRWQRSARGGGCRVSKAAVCKEGYKED